MSELTIITNNVPRFTIDAYELTLEERKEFDYLNWEAMERGEDSATFFRYHGQLYDMGEFMSTRGHSAAIAPLSQWDGYQSDSFFSGIVVRYVSDGYGGFDPDSIVVGRYYS